MKKSLLFLLAIGALGLASCNNGTKENLDTGRFDEVSSANILIAQEYKDAYNINFNETSNSNRLYTGERTEDNYYEIYVSTDLLSSMFVVNTENAVTKDSKVNRVNNLTFTDSLYDSEKNAISNEFYNKDYGFFATTKNYLIQSQFPEYYSRMTDEDETNDLTAEEQKEVNDYVNPIMNKFNQTISWSAKEQDATLAAKAVKDGLVVAQSTVYVPIYATRTAKGGVVLGAYIFIPVYVGFTVDGQEIVKSDNDKGYELVDSDLFTLDQAVFEFRADNSDYLAKTKETESE